MASDASFAQFVADQVSGAGTISTRFMFGEYALYCNEKVVGLICDNKLFVKPTAGGRAFIGTPVEAPAYTGAKPSFLIEDKLEDRAWLTELIRLTEAEVSLPVKKTSSVRKELNAKESAAAATPAAPVMVKPTPKAANVKGKKTVKRAGKKTPSKPSKKPAGKTGKIAKSNATKTAKKTPPKRTNRSASKARRSAKKATTMKRKTTMRRRSKAGRK